MMHSDAARAWQLAGFTDAPVPLTLRDHVRQEASTARRAYPIFVVVAVAVVVRTVILSSNSTWPEVISLETLLWLALVCAFSFLQCNAFLWTMESALVKMLPRISSSCDVQMLKEMFFLSLYPVWIALIVAAVPFGTIVSSLLVSLSLHAFNSGLRHAGIKGTAERISACMVAGGVAVLALYILDGMTSILLGGLLGYPFN